MPFTHDEDEKTLPKWGQPVPGLSVSTPARKRAERRVHPRVLFSVPLNLHYLAPGGIASSRGISLDLSQGGLSALLQINLLVGEAVEIDLQLPCCSLYTVAIVRHVSSLRSGFEFVGLSQQEKQQISSVISRK